MVTTNIWQKFKALIPEDSQTVVTIKANHGNGTSQAQLRDGSVVTVKGESVPAAQKAFVQDGEIKGTAPELTQYEIEV